MVLGKRWLFLTGNGAEIRPLEMSRKGPALKSTIIIFYGKKMVISMPPNTHTVHIRFSKF